MRVTASELKTRRDTLGRSALRAGALGLACTWSLPAAGQGLAPSDVARALAELAESAPTGPAPADRLTAAVRPDPVVATSFTLRDVAFTGPSGYFSAEALDRIVGPWLGTQMTAKSAQALAAAVNAAYQARGADLAQAQVVAVDAGAGQVTLELFEARLGAVSYQARRASPAYLAMRTGLRRGDLADTRRIAERLERLALTDGVLADVGFSPGSTAGTTDLTVALAEPPVTTTELRVDNYGEAGTGALRGLMSFRINNLTGWNDPLSLDLTLLQGARAIVGSYSRTVSAAGTVLGATASYQTTNSITGPTRSSWSRSVAASVAQPLALSVDRQIWLSASAELFAEQATTLGFTSADQSGFFATLSLSGDHSWEDGWLARAGWSLAASAGRYDDGVLAASGLGFASLAASAQLEAPLGTWGRLVALGAGQMTPGGTLPSRLGFTVTSPLAVPGYDIGLSQGAAGYWGRLQIEAAQPLPLPDAIDLRPYAFGAVGEAFDFAGAGWVGQGQAAALGLGLSGAIGETLSFDAQLGRSLTPVLGNGPGWALRAGLSARF